MWAQLTACMTDFGVWSPAPPGRTQGPPQHTHTKFYSWIFGCRYIPSKIMLLDPGFPGRATPIQPDAPSTGLFSRAEDKRQTSGTRG